MPFEEWLNIDGMDAKVTSECATSRDANNTLAVGQDYPVAQWKAGEVYVFVIGEKGRAKGKPIKTVLFIESIAEKPASK